MAETIGQHQIASFTSPVNGDPLDANVTRGNDNTIRNAYVDHDADPGIHVQSSTLASRPSASVIGRKWITVSSGRYQLWYDDGTRWHEVASDAINVDCLADANLTKGDVVKITGFNNGQNLPTVNKVTASTDVAFGVVENTVTANNLVQIVNTGLIEDVDTNGYAVGTILYPNTSGGWTSTKPTSGSYQPAGYVLRGNSSNGVLYVECSAPRIVERSDNTVSTLVLRDASGNFSAGTVTAAAAVVTGDLTVDTSTLKVDSTNNRVGIGTATPSATGHLVGPAAASGNLILQADAGSSTAYWLTVKAANTLHIGGTGGAEPSTGRIVLDGDNMIFYSTSGVERARFTTGGALVAGVGGAAAGSEVLCARITDSGTAPLSSWNTATTGNNFFAGFYTEGTATLRGSITYNRGAGQVAYNITSDERLKDHIADAEDAGALVDALQVRQFDWKETGNHLDYGFVAQELHAVAPHAVTVPEDSAAMWSVDYSKLVPMLVKEVQALRARVAALESQP